MESEGSQPKVILPTLASNFNYAINEVLKRMNTEDNMAIWRSIRTLYRILPPEIYTKVKDKYEKIESLRNQAIGQGIDAYQTVVENRSNVEETLENEAEEFFRTCYAELYEGKFLFESKWRPESRVKGLKSLEDVAQ